MNQSSNTILPPGTVVAAAGLAFIAAGAIYFSAATSVLGIVLGATACFRGARALGVAVMALATVVLLVGLYFGSASIPGSYGLPSDAPNAPPADPRYDAQPSRPSPT